MVRVGMKLVFLVLCSSHAKFSVPLVELVYNAIHTCQGLFEELGAEASDEVSERHL